MHPVSYTHLDVYKRQLLNDSERLLATILISNNFVNVTIIMLCNYFFASTIHFGNSVILEFLLITIVLSFGLLLFGEIMPKIYSGQNTLKFCREASPAISFLEKFFAPSSALLVRSSFLVNRCVAKKNYNISVDELSQALELTDKSEISEESNICLLYTSTYSAAGYGSMPIARNSFRLFRLIISCSLSSNTFILLKH